jgi:hypothetical protein
MTTLMFVSCFVIILTCFRVFSFDVCTFLIKLTCLQLSLMSCLVDVRVCGSGAAADVHDQLNAH